MRLTLPSLFLSLGVLLLAATATPIFAQGGAASLTTLYAENAGGNDDGGVFFDVENLTANDVVITAWDTNLAASYRGNVSVWYRLGTFAGSESSPAGWIPAGTASSVTSAGQNTPTPFSVGSLTIPAGTTYGIAITLTAGPASGNRGHLYTRGTGSNQTYNDGVIELRAGSAKNLPFSTSGGNVFRPRVWNGTIFYGARAGTAASVPTLGGPSLLVLLVMVSAAAFTVIRRQRIG